MHEQHIDSQGFDFIGMMSEIEEFGRKNLISQKMIYRAQTVFEEQCVQILLPQLPEHFDLLLTMSYAQKAERLTMQIRYSGLCFDPAKSDNTLSLARLGNDVRECTHREINEGEYTNLIDLVIQ